MDLGLVRGRCHFIGPPVFPNPLPIGDTIPDPTLPRTTGAADEATAAPEGGLGCGGFGGPAEGLWDRVGR